MTTLANRPNTALLVIDVQNGVVDGNYERDSAWGAPPPDKVVAHTNLYWSNQTAPGRTAGTVKTTDVDFGAP